MSSRPNAAALKAGLRVGMPATKAQALVKELVIHHADPGRRRRSARASRGLGAAVLADRCRRRSGRPRHRRDRRQPSSWRRGSHARRHDRAPGSGRHYCARGDRRHPGRRACPGPFCGPAGSRRSGAGEAPSGSSRCRSRRCGWPPTSSMIFASWASSGSRTCWRRRARR